MERHLARVAARLPSAPAELIASTDEAGVVVLHLWQAVQVALDLALTACVKLNLGGPESYREAFERLAGAGHLAPELAERLKLAAAFRKTMAHAYEKTGMGRVYAAAVDGPPDLRAFIAALRPPAAG
jgi:uncharacterized protein YutE (UPF0331/DUF86 family)